MAADAAPASLATPGLGSERPHVQPEGSQEPDQGRGLRAHDSWRRAALGGTDPSAQSRVAVFPQDDANSKARLVELGRARNLTKSARELIVQRALQTDEQDAERLLRNIRERMDRQAAVLFRVQAWTRLGGPLPSGRDRSVLLSPALQA